MTLERLQVGDNGEWQAVTTFDQMRHKRIRGHSTADFKNILTQRLKQHIDNQRERSFISASACIHRLILTIKVW